MIVKVSLLLSDGHKLEDSITIEEFKLGELDDNDIEAAIEMRIRSWVDRHLAVSWEVQEDS
jgi:hypothetical protein